MEGVEFMFAFLVGLVLGEWPERSTTDSIQVIVILVWRHLMTVRLRTRTLCLSSRTY